jgi:hypothetical protein
MLNFEVIDPQLSKEEGSGIEERLWLSSEADIEKSLYHLQSKTF